MPPNVHQYSCSVLAHFPRFSPPASPENRKYLQGAKRMMKFPARKLIPVLVFVLSSFSILRLLRIAITTSSSSNKSLFPLQPLNPTVQRDKQTKTHPNSSILTEKEFRVLSDVIVRKAPCNVLIFGFESRYLALSSINSGGSTVILDDEPEVRTTTKEVKTLSSARIYGVKYYKMEAKRAYKLLKHARESPVCTPNTARLQNSKCKLALRNLPPEVYEIKWDVIVVDGPRGDDFEVPGRMGSIYTAAVLARAGNNTTDVFVHDVHRTAEKWFSWEFLCEENLVLSKGNLWHFRVLVRTNSSRFCTPKKVLVE